MLGKYRTRIAGLPAAARSALMEEFELDIRSPGRAKQRPLLVPGLPMDSFAQAVDDAGLVSADVVLALLRRGMVREAERVAGVPVTRLASNVPPMPTKVQPPAASWEGARLLSLREENPRMHGSDAWLHYAAARVGMTRAALMKQGVTRRDMREWENRGWARFERIEP